MEEGECIEHPLLSKAIENAQKKVEEMHFDIRKQLLAYDNVMNQQREAVYRERKEILEDEDIIDRTLGIIEDTARAQLDKIFARKGEDSAESDLHAVCVRLNALFWPGISKHIEGVQTEADLEKAAPELIAEIRDRFRQRTEALGEDISKQIYRFILLEVLDTNWKEHLLAMDELRRGIGLRAIGQKDPLIEYQFESFNLFQNMLTQVREGITEFAFRVTVVDGSRKKERSRWVENRDAILLPPSAADAGPASLENPGTAASAQKTQPIVNAQKVGRNDPCPCGSGKKYKQCCGR